MSALMPLSKAFRVLSNTLWEDGEALAALDPVGGQFLQYMAGAYQKAADKLAMQSRAECSGEDKRGETPPAARKSSRGARR